MSTSQLPKSISKIRFGLLSPDEIRRMSVERIMTADTFDEDGSPIPTGLMDSALGTIDPGQRCATCGNRIGSCMGHFGHIELQRPVIHVGFNKIIYKILQVICRSCSRIMLPPEQIIKEAALLKKTKEAYGVIDTDLVETLWKAAKRNRDMLINPKVDEDGNVRGCFHCDAFQQKVRLEKPTSYMEEYQTADGNKVADRLTALDVQNRLKTIPSDDGLLLGIDPVHARAEWMILDVLPVPPVAVRPSITLDSGIRSEDDLTHKLVDIIRINQRLQDNRESGAPQLIVEDLWELLQYHITTYFDNEVSGIPPARHRSGRALRTITQRLKGKEGRFRSNLSGKRVDFSARTVISPDPLLSINEVGVPREIAEILTVPERVTEWNIEEMKELVMRGPKGHPGVNYIIRDDGRRVDLRFVRDPSLISDSLRPGFTVERHLRDGDVVLFNRQPSLHRMSIMAHYVRVMPHKTFRLNLCVCLSGDTELITDFGKIRIDKLVKNAQKYSPVSTNWDQEREIYYSGIAKTHLINPAELGLKSYEIITKSGRKIRATSEHPFYTKNGQIRAEMLVPGDKLAIYPIEYPDVDFFGPEIADKEEFRKTIPSNVYNKDTISELDEQGLFNIPSTSSKQMILARLSGHIVGDGTLIVTPEGSRLIFRSSERTAIENMKNDLASLGIEAGEITRFETTENQIITASGKLLNPVGTVYFLEIRRKPLAIYFNFLGISNGDKTSQEFEVPDWIKNGSQMIKREFLRSYFGSKMSTPKVRKNSRKKFEELRFKISKVEGLTPYGFIEDIQEMLQSFGVRMILRKPVKGNLRKKDNKWSYSYTSAISEEDENMYNFFLNVGFTYAVKKEQIARIASEYLRLKLQAKEMTTNKLAQSIILRNQGMTYETIAKDIEIDSWHTVASWANKGMAEAGLPTSFPTYDEWLQTQELTQSSGFVWDGIESINEIYLDRAYDITTNDANHNFIADNFLTSNCRPYNADFDGDEMNLHVPQSEESRAEASILMLVQEQISTPRYGGPIIGAVQDFITGAYLFTKNGTRFPRSIASELVSAAGVDELPEPDEFDEDGTPMWSGKALFSTLLPSRLNYVMRNKFCLTPDVCTVNTCVHEGFVQIVNGKLIRGIIDSTGFGAEVANSVLHRILKEYGSIATRIFLDGITKMLSAYITRWGFSMGLDDVDVSIDGRAEIAEIVNGKKDRVDELVAEFRSGKLERSPGKSLKETLEAEVQNVLSEARDEAATKSAQFIGLENEAVIMAKTGARGNMMNLGQMSACVGQQSVRGNRIERGFIDRTLPHFKRGDLSAFGRGFVDSSFRSGLNPIEYFMHACGGREGLVDTAVRTSSSGYMQRRLVNAMQDLSAHYDKTVRNSTGNIIQFVYGDDNVDPAKSDNGKAVNLDVLMDRLLESEDEVE